MPIPMPFFDTSFLNDLQGMVSQLEEFAVGLFVLVVLASLARTVLWALLTPVLGKFAGLVANLCVWMFAAALLTHPALGMAAVNYSYAVASQFIGGAGGLPDFSGVIDGAVNGAVNQLLGAFPF
ncbi:hypothetical protein G7K71_02890 [Desulfofundulus sp. TPOSR]|uniref:hypothetical protein n=1 Tax=Desulfofundulus sp. TPOSR TaxID=2714340 RepID=UPI00140916D5|nr:hypothetical protein [Desulfofundulus sp. TPOSR]NHM25973.1 hypothetical protein [Desulfofundulus sp. TPOSR]